MCVCVCVCVCADGSAWAPSTFGSGGQHGYFWGIEGEVQTGLGGRGGGAIFMEATTSMTLQAGSRISADGARSEMVTNFAAGGGGAGGSVFLVSPSVVGNGVVTANGGEESTTSYSGGGGAGGRIAVHASAAVSDLLTLQAWGGDNGCAGAAGTIYVAEAATTRLLIVAQNDEPHDSKTVYPSQADGGPAVLSEVVIDYANVFVPTDRPVRALSAVVTGSATRGGFYGDNFELHVAQLDTEGTISATNSVLLTDADLSPAELAPLTEQCPDSSVQTAAVLASWTLLQSTEQVRGFFPLRCRVFVVFPACLCSHVSPPLYHPALRRRQLWHPQQSQLGGRRLVHGRLHRVDVRP